MKRYVVTFVSCLLFAFTYLPEEIQLKYQFKVGDEYSWVQSKKQSVKQTFMGMEQEMTNNVHGEYLLKVVDLNANAAKLETQFVKIKASAKTFIGTMVMDSDGPDEVTANKMIKAVVNKPFYVYLNPRGDVINIEGTEKIHNALNAIKSDDKQDQLMLSVLKHMLSEPSIKANFKEVFVVYPEKKVKTGDSWTTKIQPGMNFPMSLENTWSVAEILPANVNLNADGVITTTDKTSTVEFAGMKARADLRGKQTVKTNINLKTGMPYKQDGQADLSGTMTFLAGGMIPADMEVPVEMKYKTTNVLKKKQPTPQ